MKNFYPKVLSIFFIFSIFSPKGWTFTIGQTCPADPCDGKKTYICHATHSSANPYNTLHLDINGLNGHDHHPGDICASVGGSSCPTQYDPGNITVFCPITPKPGSGGCTGTDCQTIVDSATFDFQVLSGGINDNLYVCGLGFNTNSCATCNSEEDSIVVDFSDGTHQTLFYGNQGVVFPFSTTKKVLKAHVYLNSLNYSAGWYVRYCLDLLRVVVGPRPTSGLQSVIDGKITLVGANDNGYLAQSGLQYAVKHNCKTSADTTSVADGNDPNMSSGDPLSSLQTEIVNTHDVLCLNGISCAINNCSWTVSFQESAKCIRGIKSMDCTQPGGICIPFAADISTMLDASIKFQCGTASCQ
jgi:hypothetical protein